MSAAARGRDGDRWEGEWFGLGLRGKVGAAGPWPWAGAGGWEAQAAGLLLFSIKKNREQLKRIKRKAKNKNKMVGHICKALRNISNPTKMVPTK